MPRTLEQAEVEIERLLLHLIHIDELAIDSSKMRHDAALAHLEAIARMTKAALAK
jgi:hypothetical protein